MGESGDKLEESPQFAVEKLRGTPYRTRSWLLATALADPASDPRKRGQRMSPLVSGWARRPTGTCCCFELTLSAQPMEVGCCFGPRFTVQSSISSLIS